MKIAAIPTDGETLSGFVARGLASRDAASASGHYVKTGTVLGKLETRLKIAHKKAATTK
ncbi:MAG: hypothetical protein Q8L44_00595 [Sulfuritalea sp.]|nr:hypothetical protein [Sulfuritalea sp.]